MMNRDRVEALLERRKQLSDFLYEKKDDLQRVHSISNLDSSPGSAWVLQLADNITLATRAPTAWAPSRPLHDFHGHPPAPQFEQMRAGKLEALHHTSQALGLQDAITADAKAKAKESSTVDDVHDSAKSNTTHAQQRKRKLRALGPESVDMYIGKHATRLVVESDSEDEDDDDDDEEEEEEEEGAPGTSLASAEQRRQQIEEIEAARHAAPVPLAQTVPPPVVPSTATTGSTRQIQMSFGGDSSDDEEEEVASD